MQTDAPPIPPPRVLVVDDETQIRRLLDISLRAQGYRVLQATTGEEGLSLLTGQGADLVVLDIGLPGLDGHQVLKDIRAWSSVPIIVLSVRSSEEEKVALLDSGANDYVTKPFGVQELMARVRALLRQATVTGDAERVFDDGSLCIDLGLREVHLNHAPVLLSRKEFALLALLWRHAGRVITQPQLLREIWGPTHTEDTHYLRILVGKLRQKLGDDATAPRYIATEPGVGLRFVGKSKSDLT